MNRQELTDIVYRKKSVLCVGLDSEYAKIPAHIREGRSIEDAVFEFNKEVVDATINYTVAYKPNLAFYEAMGLPGWSALYRTVAYIRSLNEPVFIIADAKRADIGNTSRLYASSFFGDGKTTPDFDAVTVAPYMGKDSVSPFLSFEGKWVILLALTSNPGADDFQLTETPDGMQLFERVLEQSKQWGNAENMMYVVGATRAEMLRKVRAIVPDNFLLIPGVGAQGGDLNEVLKNGWNKSGGLLINASRSIIFAASGVDFATAAADEAARMQKEMARFINQL
ncbi:MAG: orotidine 5'-phosphate decarboxylase [Bacteroidetes bacterium GWF2_43_63]|nr:MAG: orotidine 5'-phosphate decarboxylase [Bacteroidetes bacterium GWE2_42_42]OFY55885.1 MAG: orotidine 5'-phosphate decarboxylase [Bacteroidetes bacterium GWF2_43_63]HCB63495.1 orotidine-5'-phosphate decarboxylase [Bacteroidales bacterium]HCY22903.1 orotidine-5'-phosphate decarboxylase [Bacteroidales bacterium]